MRRRTLIVAFAVVVVGAFNSVKAVHIDDALYLAVAKQIVAHPFDPYGFEINWQHTPQPAYAVSISPPLVSYWHALWFMLGFSEGFGLHLAMFPWLALLGWGVVSLLSRVTPYAGLATAAMILSPAVFAGTNLMLDVPMTAALTAGIECALRAADRKSISWLTLSCLAGSAAVLIKYPAVVFVGICLLIAILRRNWKIAIPAACCTAAFLAWQVTSRNLYGAGQVSQATSFLERFHGEGARTALERTIQQLALIGAAFPIWIVSLFHGRSRFSALLFALAVLFGCRHLLLLNDALHGSPAVVVGFQVAVFAGAFAVGETIVSVLSRPIAAMNVTALAWMFGVVALTSLSAPFVAVRYLLPAMPAFLYLQASTLRPGRLAYGVSLAVFASLGLTIAVADLRWANFYPTTVSKIRSELPDAEIKFAGHWGMQWYAAKAGMGAWDARWNHAQAGPSVVVPMQADPTPIHPFIRRRFELTRTYTLSPATLGMALRKASKKSEIGTNFYGWDFPHLPWSLSSEPAETILLLEIR